MNRLRLLMTLWLFVIVLALQTIPAQAYPVSGWTKIYEGIERADGMATSPRLMRAFAFRINLRNPDVWTGVTNGNGGSPYDTTLQGTDAFLYNNGLKVATNACHWDVNTPAPYADVLGLLICGGNIISNAGGIWPHQMNFTGDKIASIVASNNNPTGVWNGIETGPFVLQNGVVQPYAPAVNPYTGYGITSDGKYMIMVCVDGRQPGWSDGCTYAELGQWLKDFGAWNGVHLDGGGSTCMVRADTGVVNRPCYGYVRQVAVSFGAYSVPGTFVGPDACSMNANRVDIVVRGQWDVVYLKTWTSSGGWAAPVSLGGATIQDPAIVSVADGRLDVVIVDKNTNYFQKKTWTIAGGWTGWTNLGTSLWSSGPALARRDATHFDIAGRSIYGDIYHTVYNTANSTMESWGNVGMNTYYPPGMAVQGNGCCCIFLRSDVDGSIIMRWGNGSTWNSWGLGGWFNGRPSAVCRSGNCLDVFVRGADGSIRHIAADNNVVWGAWEALGGNVGKIAVCSPNANQINTYHRTTDDWMYQKTWTSTGGWGGYIPVGTYFP